MDIKVTHLDLTKSPQGEVILSVLANQDSYSFLLTPELLNQLNEQSLHIFNPNYSFEQHLDRLKKFKRQVFTHYRQEKDPEVKQKQLDLYIQTKNLVMELENRS